MKANLKNLMLMGLAVAAMSAASLASAFGVGDPAPALKTGDWVKGRKYDKFEKGKVYVVEFWATWCGPCKTSIPHLTEMAKANKDVKFLGVSVWEEGGPNKDGVQKFVKDMGATMDYNVAIDTTENTMATTWMEAADQNGIPTAFIIKDGMVAWIGHPMEMEEPLKQVKSKDFDITKAKEAANKEAEQMKKVEAVVGEMQEALQGGDFPAAFAAMDKLYALVPDDQKNSILSLKLALMWDVDGAGAEKLAMGYLGKEFKDDAMVLNEVAWGLVDPEAEKEDKHISVALAYAKRAVEVTKEKDENILDTLALCYFHNGDKKMAIETQKKAIKVLKDSGHADPDVLKEFEGRLKQFEESLKDG
ncbi:MAG: redoxin domain-containing protein [Armatimonadetes bacterium]|nr:redoxin domain-containing protein [Armatimonadota bacterium]